MKSSILVLALLGTAHIAFSQHEHNTSPTDITCAWSYREQAKDLARVIDRLRLGGNYDDNQWSHEPESINQTTVRFDKLQEAVDEIVSHSNNDDSIKVIVRRAWQWWQGHYVISGERIIVQEQKKIAVEEEKDMTVKVILSTETAAQDNDGDNRLNPLMRLRHYVFGWSTVDPPASDPLPHNHQYQGSDDKRDSNNRRLTTVTAGDDAHEEDTLSNKVQEWAHAKLRQWVGCQCQCSE